ncbi:MAG: hypothetical protein AAFU53_06800 [Cyanobacteria bacterium J06632_3]
MAASATSASVEPTADLNGLTGDDLLAAQVDAQVLPTGSSNAIAAIVRESITASHSNAVTGFSHQSSTAVEGDVEVLQTESTHTQLAQGPSEDTFAPLSDEEIRQQLLIDPDFEPAAAGPRPVPSSTFLTPSAYGADWRDAYIGVAGVTAGNVRNTVDGSATLGFGVGDAVNAVGVEIGVGIISLDGFADDGTIGFKVHKVFPEANNLAVALGWMDPIQWGSASETDTFYGVVTQRFDLRDNPQNTMPITASVGVGTGIFRTTGAIEAGDNAPNVFGSVGWRVIPQVSLNTSWTGSALGAAVSTAPFELPLVITAGVSDITDNTADGTRFHGSMGYSFSF